MFLLIFSFDLNRTKTFHVMWIFCWKHCLGGSSKYFWVWLLCTIIWLHIYHQGVTAIKLEAQLRSLKTYFDEKEDTTLPDVIEKIEMLPKSSKGLLSTSHTTPLPARDTVSERPTSILRRIKNCPSLLHKLTCV